MILKLWLLVRIMTFLTIEQMNSNILVMFYHGFCSGVELSAAPNGYSCNRNSWDAPQYCLCNKGERIVKFASAHDNRREDRKWNLRCKAIPQLNFSSDKWISITQENEWDAPQEWNGVASNSFLVGFSSHHDNHREDRKYKFFTARSNSFNLRRCSRWTTLNDFDGRFNLLLGDGEVIAAIKSVHSNRHEDRRFSVITCEIDRQITGNISSVQSLNCHETSFPFLFFLVSQDTPEVMCTYNNYI